MQTRGRKNFSTPNNTMSTKLCPTILLAILLNGCTTSDQATKPPNENLDAVDFQTLLSRAEKCSAEAQLAVSERYQSGTGVAKNETKAFEWAKKAANMGNTAAMRTLTTMHLEGIGVEKSWSRAAQWIRNAANKGDTMAMNTLAQFYEMGLGGWKKAISSHDNGCANQPSWANRLGCSTWP